MRAGSPYFGGKVSRFVSISSIGTDQKMQALASHASRSPRESYLRIDGKNDERLDIPYLVVYDISRWK